MSTWSQACEAFNDGEISEAELRCIAEDLFDGDALTDVLSEIASVKDNPQGWRYA